MNLMRCKGTDPGQLREVHQSQLLSMSTADNSQHPFDHICEVSPTIPTTVQGLHDFRHIWQSSTTIPTTIQYSTEFEHIWATSATISPSIFDNVWIPQSTQSTSTNQVYQNILGNVEGH